MQVSLLLFVVVLAACSLVPKDGPPQVPLPAHYSDGSTIQATTLDEWWQHFNSPALNAVITAVRADNQDLTAAVARIEQARASLRIAGSGRYPSVEASLGSTRTWLDGSSFGAGFGGSGARGGGFGGEGFSHDAGLTVSYELDLFGRIRAQRAAADARLSSSIQDRAAVELLTLAEAADSFITATSLHERIALARENLRSNQQVLAIVEARLREGATSRLEVAQQRTVVSNTAASVAALEEQLRASENALAVLQGLAPTGQTAGEVSLATLQLPAIDAGLPASLLTRRPDLASAESELIAANADIGAARAALLPSISLTGSGSFGIDPATTIGTLAAALAAPIFQGGKLQGEVARVRARRAELVASYRQAVLVAVREVEDALNAVRAAASRQAALAIAADEARTATRLARERYTAGRIDFQTLLDVQIAQVAAEDAHVDAHRSEFSAAIALYKALGGGWESAATER